MAREIIAPNGPWNYSCLGMSTFDRNHYEKYFSLPDWTLEETLAVLNHCVKNGVEKWDAVSSDETINHSPEECSNRFWHIHTLSKLFVQNYMVVARQRVTTLKAVKALAQYEAKMDIGMKAIQQLKGQEEFKANILRAATQS
eukprot:CAMPEP_0170193132 /NCGR_PEP_ID=MMETSP0040_2-20121228/56182_1 /TAXON_ID=641309 /ORGANISM="Lotharella oceanica, Strain CCMP622" /LENGTH=141 /DNA_ID=CAMNT_0010441687 /DNA_START=99 /DNA_END=524 /DNA_ORIENTATION=+